ncbi:MAG: hypothetical protein AAB587_02090 [Patescibacteria group bacterium]
MYKKISFLLFNLTLPAVALAQVRIQNPLRSGVDSLGAFVQVLTNDIVLPVGSVIVVLMIIYSGFLFVTAQGNPTKIETARSAFFWSAVGALVLLGSWSIAQVIKNTVNQITG